MGREQWDDLNRRLVAESSAALAGFDGVEGGYFLRDTKAFLGASFPTEPTEVAAKSKARRLARGLNGPPPREVDLVEIQADAAIRLGRELMEDPAEILPLKTQLADVERRAIQRTLVACGGNRTQTVEKLGSSRRQLFDKIREYDPKL